MDPTAAALVAASSLFRRAAVVELARAAAAYQPTSYDDAVAVRRAVVAAIEGEMDDAGDAGDDGTYAALLALRTAVVRDLTARGADLAPLRQVTPPAALPALTLANQLYADATRADDLVARTDPAHPLFLPTSFRALAA